MTASEVIQQIEALPPAEQARVIDYVHKRVGAGLSGKTIRFATDEESRAAGDRVVEEFAEVFERLSH